MVCAYEAETDRYLVQILPDIGLKKLKLDNLVVLEVPPGFGYDGGAGNPSGAGGPSSSSASAEQQPNGEGRNNTGGEDGQWAQGGDDNDMADAFKDCMPLFHDAFWSATALDVEFTLAKVIHKVLRDMSVDKKARKQRADALLKLGVLLQEPMKQRRRKAVASGSGASSNSVPAGSLTAPPEGSPAVSTTSVGSKKSVLARFRPRVSWRPSSDKKLQKEKAAKTKQKRMEDALAMMAAGASTEDVDEMSAARAAMDAEMEAAEAAERAGNEAAGSTS